VVEVGKYIREGWYNAIKALNVGDVWDETNVKEETNPYFVLSTQTEASFDDDEHFNRTATILIKCVGFGSVAVGKSKAESIGIPLLGLVPDKQTQPFSLSANGLNLLSTVLESTNTLVFDAKDKVYVTKLYRFKHQIEQI